MTKIYGIPKVISSSELFLFNQGTGKLRVNFEGGVCDPKINRPATYTTASEFEQMVIEASPLFGTKVFRYNGNGQIIDMSALEQAQKNETLAKGRKTSVKGKTAYDDVKTIGEATEVLLELGVPASELGGADAVLSAMLAQKVAFPNLELK